MKKIVLAIVIAGFASAVAATPAKKQCLAICPPVEEQIEQTEPSWPEDMAPMWAEEVAADPFAAPQD
ncbi:hypothetical protein [Massilia sp. H6]|uniref:hypothetical protein n=1 Tax=Massilia sp. H6 TaxID=2970464 RepID=UPI002167897C|nr:hypothetical protein [Massilia sp. H6]UVW27497.1 hypothetical protein NRS07_13180 [Massilia sp. H6]